MGHQVSKILLRLTFIGSFEATDLFGDNVLPASKKGRAVLAYLAMNSGKWVSRTRLARMLWSEVSEEQGRTSLRQVVYELNRALGKIADEILDVQRERLQLVADLLWVDATFEMRPEGDAAAALGDINVFSGSHFLDELNNISPEFDDWLLATRQQLEENVRKLSERAIDGMRTGVRTPQQRVDLARRAVRADPTNEAAVRELMRALAANGHRAQAVMEFVQCRSTMQARLDLQPSSETQQLYSELRRGTAFGRRKAKPPAAPPAS